ncbi:MAG: PAS domain-containing protein [Acetobacteraceae bacterium]|nr:PAS domain-containing protein [Acetobacteraceae bacterium]
MASVAFDFPALFDTLPSPSLLKGVLENATVAILLLDGQQRCAFMNEAAERLTGHTLAEIQGRRLHDVIHHARPDGTPFPVSECPIERAFPENSHRQGEETCVHKDGHFYPVAFSASPIRDNASQPIGMTVELRDIGVDTRREAAARHAQKMEAIGRLTGGIAHDFNNLLTGIASSLELMRIRLAQGRLDTLPRYIDAASASAQRAATLTHHLLAFGRRLPLDPKPMTANRLVASMEATRRRTLGEAIRLEIVAAGDLWTTLCDPRQLENGLLNLALNAREAMPHGGTFSIETCNAQLDHADAAREAEPGQYVCVRATDTGVGMTPEVMDRAFEPFFTTKAIGAGIGLGLSMLYGFARQSNGFCEIHSDPGQGTTVTLCLPRLVEAETHEGVAAATGALRAGPSRTGI